MVSAECDPVTGVWKSSPQESPGWEFLVREPGGKKAIKQYIYVYVCM